VRAILRLFEILYIIGIFVLGFFLSGFSWWIQWGIVIILLPLVLVIEHLLGVSDFRFFKGKNDDDPSGNDNVRRKFTDYM
jgi:fatty acid desaturase